MQYQSQQEPSLIRTLKGHKQSVIALDLYPSCKYVASAGMDNIIFLWNLTKKSAPLKLIGHKSQIHDLKFSPAGNIIVSASNDQSLKFWDIDYEYSGKQTTLIKAHNARIRGLSFSCDGLLLASCGDDKLIKVWSTVDRRLQYSLKKHNNWVRHCQFSPTATNLASCDDKFVYIWDVNTKKQIQSYSQHSGVIHKVKFHSLGNCMATCSHDTKIKLYDLRSQSVIQTYQGHKGPVKTIDFHPNSSYLISSSDDGTTKIWNSKKGQLQYTIDCHSNNTKFSRHGDYFITGGSQKVIHIWKTGFYDSLNEKIIGGSEQVDQQWKKRVIHNSDTRKSGKLVTNLTEQSNNQLRSKKNLLDLETATHFNGTGTKIKTESAMYTNAIIPEQEPDVYYNHADQFFQANPIKNSLQRQTLQSSKSMKQLKTQNNIGTSHDLGSGKQSLQTVLPPKLLNKLRRISHQLDFITKTTQILEARVTNNGDQLRRLIQLNSSFKSNIEH